jgi:hypothetical protein
LSYSILCYCNRIQKTGWFTHKSLIHGFGSYEVQYQGGKEHLVMDFAPITTNCLRWGYGPVGRVLAYHIQGPGSTPSTVESRSDRACLLLKHSGDRGKRVKRSRSSLAWAIWHPALKKQTNKKPCYSQDSLQLLCCDINSFMKVLLLIVLLIIILWEHIIGTWFCHIKSFRNSVIPVVQMLIHFCPIIHWLIPLKTLLWMLSRPQKIQLKHYIFHLKTQFLSLAINTVDYFPWNADLISLIFRKKNLPSIQVSVCLLLIIQINQMGFLNNQPAKLKAQQQLAAFLSLLLCLHSVAQCYFNVLSVFPKCPNTSTPEDQAPWNYVFNAAKYTLKWCCLISQASGGQQWIRRLSTVCVAVSTCP